jgi:hypothetical protein
VQLAKVPWITDTKFITVGESIARGYVIAGAAEVRARAVSVWVWTHTQRAANSLFAYAEEEVAIAVDGLVKAVDAQKMH